MAKARKGIKKQFFDVAAPMTSTKISLYGGSPEELDGKIVIIDLTRNLRGRSFIMKMRVKNEEGKLSAEPVSLALAGSYIKRVFRKGTDYVEDSFKIECRDGNAVMKPFMITRKKVSRAVRKKIRDNAKEYLQGYAKTRTRKEVLTDIMANKLQKELSFKIKKIYPLALCEIRVFEILGEK